MASNWNVVRVDQTEDLTEGGGFVSVYKVIWKYGPTDKQYTITVPRSAFTDQNVRDLISQQVAALDAVHALSG